MTTFKTAESPFKSDNTASVLDLATADGLTAWRTLATMFTALADGDASTAGGAYARVTARMSALQGIESAN